MPRIRKRLLALGVLSGAAAVSVLRRRRATRPSAPAPSAEAPIPSAVPSGHEEALPASDSLVDAETAAAAAEAGAIGGRAHPADADLDPAMQPVSEGGGGESEGFELAEADLIENASHGSGRGDPSQDALRPEAEADEVTGIAGEADEEHLSDGADASAPGQSKAR